MVDLKVDMMVYDSVEHLVDDLESYWAGMKVHNLVEHLVDDLVHDSVDSMDDDLVDW